MNAGYICAAGDIPPAPAETLSPADAAIIRRVDDFLVANETAGALKHALHQIKEQTIASAARLRGAGAPSGPEPF